MLNHPLLLDSLPRCAEGGVSEPSPVGERKALTEHRQCLDANPGSLSRHQATHQSHEKRGACRDIPTEGMMAWRVRVAAIPALARSTYRDPAGRGGILGARRWIADLPNVSVIDLLSHAELADAILWTDVARWWMQANAEDWPVVCGRRRPDTPRIVLGPASDHQGPPTESGFEVPQTRECRVTSACSRKGPLVYENHDDLGERHNARTTRIANSSSAYGQAVVCAAGEHGN